MATQARQKKVRSVLKRPTNQTPAEKPARTWLKKRVKVKPKAHDSRAAMRERGNKRRQRRVDQLRARAELRRQQRRERRKCVKNDRFQRLNRLGKKKARQGPYRPKPRPTTTTLLQYGNW